MPREAYQPPADVPWQPQYGSMVWVVQHGLRLVAPRMKYNSDHKKLVLQTFVLLVTGASARHTDNVLPMEVLLVLKSWLIRAEDDKRARSCLPNPSFLSCWFASRGSYLRPRVLLTFQARKVRMWPGRNGKPLWQLAQGRISWDCPCCPPPPSLLHVSRAEVLVCL
jgi:hypothetical protein